MMLDMLLVIGLVVSAFFAIHFDEAIYAILSLTIMNIILSIFYFSLGTYFAAVFQLTMGIGTVAVLFLAGEMLTRRVGTAQTSKQRILGLVVGILLSIPSILAVGHKITVTSSSSVQFSTALWELRAIDVIAQGLVILTVALGIVLLLKEKRRKT